MLGPHLADLLSTDRRCRDGIAASRRSISAWIASAPGSWVVGDAPSSRAWRSSALPTRASSSSASNGEWAFCYLDLDNLKAFNDYYGYAKANAVIRQTGDVIRHVITRSGGPGDFIGHIAGDDFVFVTSADNADEVCRGICERFDHLIRLYYDPADRGHGYIETKDRFGVQRRFPIMSVSIAAISIARARSYAALAELAAVGKRAAKAIPGSTYVRDGQTMLSDAAAG